MELKLQLVVFVLFIQGSLAVWQRMTVIKGQTLHLNCPIRNAHKNTVEWKNPEGEIMFFNLIEALRDKRYSIDKLSQTEFSISVSDVTFRDGGNYTCFEYDHQTIEKKVEVTVFGSPKMSKSNHDGKVIIKCTAEESCKFPQIYWQIDNGPEIHAHHPQTVHEGKKYVTIDMLHVVSSKNRATVKCIVRHPALSSPLKNYVKIGPKKPTTMTSPPTPHSQGSITTTRWISHGGTTAYLTTRDEHGPSSESSATLSTIPSNETVTEPTHVTSTGEVSRTSVFSNTTKTGNESSSNATSTTGWTYETTEETPFYNDTEGNKTVGSNDREKQTANKGNSSLLVFLVTCLIFALLIVVIFFGIKLRRAHITWKRVFIVTENEDSVPSEDSNKSKSSHEEKNSQGQRWRGLSNRAFTQYVSEEPKGITSVINTGAMTAAERTNIGQTFQPQTQAQTPTISNIKETEL
ncbi:cytotoxic and regulatory T-cell molecule isoform X2 [Scomber scombrus]|uniref:cytotoxic and regulatory T-cell molecule isoform X2 n=1 Tax=Scomber scombrus TaxID=13677 RepID=UPI002DDB4A78|nr:cytotoxic and regulatory T-cell molecule isoform X2 [Scomber scombrus]